RRHVKGLTIITTAQMDDTIIDLSPMRIRCPCDEDVVMPKALLIKATPADPSAPTSGRGPQKLFAVVELAELVLLDETITMEQLFLMQRVSRGFQGLIEKSLPLRRKMCLAHAPISPRTSPVLFSHILSGLRSTAATSPRRYRIENRSIGKAFGTFGIDHYPNLGGVIKVHNQKTPNGERCALRLTVGTATESWKDILIADRPLVAVHVHHLYRSVRGVEYCVDRSQSVQTLGDLHRVLGTFGQETVSLELRAAEGVSGV
ncbi:hypothetical protein LTR95_012536, partial [Oleoguttula sp. CCFEE 5521]